MKFDVTKTYWRKFSIATFHKILITYWTVISKHFGQCLRNIIS